MLKYIFVFCLLILSGCNDEPSREYEQGMAYMDGKGVEKDQLKALNYFKQGAKEGDGWSQFMLGKMYENPSVYESVIFDYYEADALNGDEEALYQLARIYRVGTIVNKDIEKSELFYEKALHKALDREKQGDANSTYRLALMYRNGWGTEKDNEKFLAISNRLKDDPVWESILFHDEVDLFRDMPNLTKDTSDYFEEQYFYWIQESARQGHSQAQAELGRIYKDKRDYKGAIKWMEKSVDQGDPYGFYLLGMSYADGEGVPKNYKKAYAYLSVADAKGWEAKREVERMARKLTPEALSRAQDEAIELYEY